jgi:hypothetical protein
MTLSRITPHPISGLESNRNHCPDRHVSSAGSGLARILSIDRRCSKQCAATRSCARHCSGHLEGLLLVPWVG